MKLSLHFYFNKIIVSGLENVPENKPVLFLPNHQNALLDVLLIGTDCNRSPWFLTRSDVFKKKLLQYVFEVLQMIPIYRIRDGRQSLQNNEAVFERCAGLLLDKEAVIMFPEANHNLKRRVRPLSKGFTRILFKALEKDPECDIQIIPVGLNYTNAIQFPDKAAVCFGQPIPVQKLYKSEDEKLSIDLLKLAVSESLKTLTTHIENEAEHDELAQKLKTVGIDFLNPNEANTKIQQVSTLEKKAIKKTKKKGYKIAKVFFTLLNLPVVLLWWKWLKPKAPEAEFMSTFRFGLSLVIYPIYYLLLFVGLSLSVTPIIAMISILVVFAFNWMYVKWNL